LLLKVDATLGWHDENSALQEWKQNKDFPALVACFTEQFSLLISLQRENAKIDSLLEEYGEASRHPDFRLRTETQEAFGKHHLPYFRHRHFMWLVCFERWNSHIFTDDSAVQH
jgi:hypothetical protein